MRPRLSRPEVRFGTPLEGQLPTSWIMRAGTSSPSARQGLSKNLGGRVRSAIRTRETKLRISVHDAQRVPCAGKVQISLISPSSRLFFSGIRILLGTGTTSFTEQEFWESTLAADLNLVLEEVNSNVYTVRAARDASNTASRVYQPQQRCSFSDRCNVRGNEESAIPPRGPTLNYFCCRGF